MQDVELLIVKLCIFYLFFINVNHVSYIPPTNRQSNTFNMSVFLNKDPVNDAIWHQTASSDESLLNRA